MKGLPGRQLRISHVHLESWRNFTLKDLEEGRLLLSGGDSFADAVIPRTGPCGVEYLPLLGG